MSVTVGITNISRASLHDGPGIRTVVYFKGCSLKCLWCHNPETISKNDEILYTPIKCIHCGRCIKICPENHKIEGNDMVLLRENCKRCKECVKNCPTGALASSKKQTTVAEVVKELMKDIHYYRQNGGITLSGGECLLQADACKEILEECKKEDIHTAIETALNVPWGNIEKVLPFCDLFFADLKILNSKKHKEFTGSENGLILENLKKLVDSGAKVTVRIPLIPTVNDSEEDIKLFAAFLCDFASKLCGIEVLRYNNLAESKYLILGKEFTDFGTPQSDDELKSFCSRLDTSLKNETTVYCIL